MTSIKIVNVSNQQIDINDVLNKIKISGMYPVCEKTTQLEIKNTLKISDKNGIEAAFDRLNNVDKQKILAKIFGDKNFLRLNNKNLKLKKIIENGDIDQFIAFMQKHPYRHFQRLAIQLSRTYDMSVFIFTIIACKFYDEDCIGLLMDYSKTSPDIENILIAENFIIKK